MHETVTKKTIFFTFVSSKNCCAFTALSGIQLSMPRRKCSEVVVVGRYAFSSGAEFTSPIIRDLKIVFCTAYHVSVPVHSSVVGLQRGFFFGISPDVRTVKRFETAIVSKLLSQTCATYGATAALIGFPHPSSRTLRWCTWTTSGQQVWLHAKHTQQGSIVFKNLCLSAIVVGQSHINPHPRD